jgi:hypothetical protein
LNSFIFSQKLNWKFSDYKTNIILYDYGQNWDKATLFSDIGPLFYGKNITINSLNISNTYSFFLKNNNLGITNYFYFNNGGFFVYKLIRIGEKINLFRLNPKFKKQNNMPLNIGLDYGGFGYGNKWVSIKIARGNQNWGSGQNIELALSEASKLYDFFEIKSDYGKVRVKYMHGFLETTGDNINRYLVAKGIEWSNKKNIIIGFSETIIYSGYNRSLDIAYLNPLSFHLEVELNNRLNLFGDDHSNAVWQVHSDFFIFNKVRFSFNLLYDEFVLDPEVQINKENGKAYSIRLSYSTPKIFNNYLNFYLQNIFIGTPTFRHGNGTNNFVQNNYPLGWEGGSDSQEISLGLNYFDKTTFIWQFNTGINWSGIENIQKRVFEPYSNYLKGTFPSGKIEENVFLNSSLELLFKHNISIKCFTMVSSKNTNHVNVGLYLSIF